jgi:hypothetical protein
MARFFKISHLEARKRALVAECEVYRRTLDLEFQNLRLYRVQLGHKWARFGPSSSFWLLAAPLARMFLRGRRGRRGGLPRMVGATLVGWQMYKRFSPFFSGLFRRAKRSGSQGAGNGEKEPPTADYLTGPNR